MIAIAVQVKIFPIGVAIACEIANGHKVDKVRDVEIAKQKRITCAAVALVDACDESVDVGKIFGNARLFFDTVKGIAECGTVRVISAC